MKKSIIAVMLGLVCVGAQASSFHGPDKAFLAQAEAVGVTQQNWDSGKNAKLTMQHAWRFTHHYVLEKGEYVHHLGEASGLDLTKLAALDVDGVHPMDVIIRDRLNQEALVILKDGKLVDEYYFNGLSQSSTHLQMSVTKSFTSMTLATLVAEGKVDMNAPITTYLPELKSSPAFANATVQQVADMRSGIKIEAEPDKSWDERMTIVQDWNGVNTTHPELESVLDFASLLNARSDVATGEAYDYQCINTEMLGLIVSRVTGRPLAEELEARLWKKVGFEQDAKLMANAKGEAVGSGGLNATPRDVARMMDVVINGGKNRAGEQVVPKAFIDNLLAGTQEAKAAWKLGPESQLAPNAWYQDQLRVFNHDGHTFIAFVGIHGQVTVGEPATGVVIHMNGAQEQTQATRTVAITFLDVIPTLLKAAARS
ncbi:beta-lactamase family protein [Shewanella submarina]|uniref:Serine hydrolase domain-containing protein n=1 Tax=Shewanella submarina TaxID=2016376 RepID=A0ABV7GIY3_9GAMM|nr:serine hydrolase [Shewanella submarina]MCL1036072.1 beta-lactamase family protein [Shewanella submarina]